MMFSDKEIKEIPESTFMRSDDEIISIREVCLSDKFDKKDLGFNSESLLSNSGRNYLDSSRSLFRDGFFPEGLEPQQARFAWTEEDGNIAALVSEPGFGTTGQTTFGKDLDAAFKSELKEADTSSSVTQSTTRSGLTFTRKPYSDSQLVTSTSTGNGTDRTNGQGACKVDKADPRSRFHFVKYVKRHGRTVKLWECGICSREFQHQYTLTRHLPTHTDERNFHCDACGKSFRQLSTLSQHRAIHSAERPYTCEVCNKTFNRVSTLISHRKTHSDEKPYKCHICPKGFHQKGNLRNHLFTHTNERPYRCNICLKGFNQQSNLVCHKNKAHSDDGCSAVSSRRNSLRLPQPTTPVNQPDSSRSSADHCEVSSTVGPYLPSIEGPSSSSWGSKWSFSKFDPEPNEQFSQDGSWGVGSGVVVDPIKTYHMGVALATKQTPFALLKPDNGTPVLVKVIDTMLPGGKQMLVPATAEDLKVGGKIVLKNEENITSKPSQDPDGSAVQIRVPVVATVVPRLQPGGRLHLAVQEPHHAYHTALSADMGEVKVEPCSSNHELPLGCKDPLPRLHPIKPHDAVSVFDDAALRPGASGRLSSCSLPPPAPSPPLDFIPLDLFEPMECIPLGPQITAVGHIDQPPPSDDSDIFIGEFEESIPLSDSD
ncbi:zinc finger protein with KRAB and SCAN domains 7-like [Amyelois transitella]|uniref:zinc finger protein with KRAB and SCAN domains 7-like n=1 Tax=Amyelois transitella TaxID=680683 RepID=UPI00298F50C2|nr:zinc finger protein with KRAB and SCAN domains 7-like [Amyelois transitella]